MNAMAIQQLVEEALERVVSAPVRIVGAGRTDAGVHAEGQVAHFTLDRDFAPDSIVGGANHYLPPDIRVLAASRVAADFHARAQALAKEYRYRLSRRSVLLPADAPVVVRVDPDIDVSRMAEAAALIEGRHDFSAFAKSGGSHRQPWRRVFRAQLVDDGTEITFRCIGDGFLRGMVRALAGTLLWVGQGRSDVQQMARLLAGGERAQAGPNAPARGLCLVQVFYPGEPGWE